MMIYTVIKPERLLTMCVFRGAVHDEIEPSMLLSCVKKQLEVACSPCFSMRHSFICIRVHWM